MTRDFGQNERNELELAIVVPCYNEEEVLKQTSQQLLDILSQLIGKKKIASSSKVWLIDDGSDDTTWDLSKTLAKESNRIRAVRLSRNRGHQNALLAGMMCAEGDAIVSIDADLQDDLGCIEKMVDEWNNGAHIVYGVRESRETDTFFKRTTALGFYKLMKIMGVNVVFNHADYRLMSRTALECLRQYHEVNLFLRGIVPLLGFRTATVKYDRKERFAGESKYPLRKMLGFALNGITSFSVVPLRIIAVLGFIVFFASVLMSVWVLVTRFFTDAAIPGWASTVLPIYLISGIQILAMGVIGEYIGRIYNETKSRPRYFIEEIWPDRREQGSADVSGTRIITQTDKRHV